MNPANPVNQSPVTDHQSLITGSQSLVKLQQLLFLVLPVVFGYSCLQGIPAQPIRSPLSENHEEKQRFPQGEMASIDFDKKWLKTI